MIIPQVHKFIVLSFLLGVSDYCIAQVKRDTFNAVIEVGVIPNLTSFQHLTKYETRYDSLILAHSQQRLTRILDGKAFIDGTSKEFIDSAIEEEKILNSIRFKENRSRYKLQFYKNGQLIDKTENESTLDSISTECNCILYDDTIMVNMGIGIFGGIGFSIQIADNRFNSSYWIDEHKRKIFKLATKDSLTEFIVIPIQEQQLILDTFPSYNPGQQLTAHLIFSTVNFLRASDFEDWAMKDEYSDENMDIMYTKGVITFTCKVRQKLPRDQYIKFGL